MAGLFAAVFGRALVRWRGAVAAVFFIAVFTLLVGAGVSVVLAVGSRGAIPLPEWEDFRALLPIGIDFETLETLQADRRLTPVTALLLAESGYAPANPPKWIEKLYPEIVLLSVAAGDREGRPDPEVLEAVEGFTLLRTDRNG